MPAHDSTDRHGARPVQVAWHVPDPAAAAASFAARFGWGPFFVMEHIPLAWARHRDEPATFDHTSAYGQAGELMVELISQHGDAPSALRDLYAATDTGVHHVAYFVDDLAARVSAERARGRAIALEARTSTGVEFVMVDTSAELGHMLELYEAGDALTRFYAWVRRAAERWDGDEPVRYLRA